MMRPMKLGGSEIIFGKGSLAHLESLKAEKAVIVLSSQTMYKNGIMKIVEEHLEKAHIDFSVYIGVEPDPSYETVLKGAEYMLKEKPDLIIALGGGSVMDAAKAMWIFYEHPEVPSLEYLTDKTRFPKLRAKARMVCIPSTAGTASEVSRSIVITDNGIKYGIGNMEMVPDVAILDPEVTVSMPKHLTAETGMDALCHAIEAFVSTRANYVSDILAKQAVRDIFAYLPRAYKEGENLGYREIMLNASMIAGLAFTNVSLGITHSIAHALGSLCKLPHGLANALLLPYVVAFNSRNEEASKKYRQLAAEISENNFVSALFSLNQSLDLPIALKEILPDENDFLSKLDNIVDLACNDGCTKTNPIIPSKEEFKEIILDSYYGRVGK
ncbi:MAG TPA: iron-containing alcohol dehydrogenase [Bacilli bacterium]